MPEQPPVDRRALGAVLSQAAPWLLETDVGPRAVDAGPCDRCGGPPRLLPTCGPDGLPGVCRDCAEVLGDDGWCDGHLEEGRAARRWAATLPQRWADLVVLWWVATGEVRIDPDRLRTAVDLGALPPPVRAALPPGSG